MTIIFKSAFMRYCVFVRFRFLLLFLFVLVGVDLMAQVQNNGAIYVGDSGQFYVGSGVYNFGVNPAVTKTSKTSAYGVMSFAGDVTMSGAGNNHYVDGYVRTYGVNLFVAPVGDGGVLAPIAVTPSTSLGVDVSYSRSSPYSLGPILGNSVRAISSKEYWGVNGSSEAVITLTWRASSDVHLLSTSLADLVILGFDGSGWVLIPSSFDFRSLLGGLSSIVAGSITSISSVDLTQYNAFTIGSKSCFPTIVSSGAIKTWDGSWIPNSPTLEDPVVINAPYTGSLSCYSVVMNADITLGNSDLLEVVDSFVCNDSSKVIMSSEASLVQRNSTALSPRIELIKVTRPMRRFDYVFLSSPINDMESFFSQLRNKNNVYVPIQEGEDEDVVLPRNHTAFQFFRTYDPTGLSAVDATASNVPIAGGFSASVLNQAPYSSSLAPQSWDDEKYSIHMKIEGVANNGNYPVFLPANGWVRVGNPYLSAISGEELLNAFGSFVRKTLYFWTFNTPRRTLTNSSTDYNNNDFAIWNYSGGVAACPTCEIPTGNIASMQSVMIRSLRGSATPSTFDITNCMRLTGNNNNFFRTASSDKFWVNLTGSSNSFSQIMVSYNELATNEYDNGFDSARIPASNSSTLSSLIGSAGYAIQTRSSFELNDVVPLGLTNVSDSQMTISLFNPQGRFMNGEVVVYLHDKQLNLYHNLSTGPYSFVMAQGSDSGRFELVYSSPSLGDEEVVSSKAIALLHNGALSIQASESMDSVTVYDITGRKIQSYDAISNTVFETAFNYPQAVYIVKVQLSGGRIVTVKLLNQ